jgi:hypothetical protein
MPYDSVLIDTYLNTPEVQAEVLKSAIEQSAILSLTRRLPNMSKSQTKMFVEDALHHHLDLGAGAFAEGPVDSHALLHVGANFSWSSGQ